MKKIRQPIITVAGHVDHGKTSILDSVRGTKIQEGEAGGITQKISFTEMPADVIRKRAGAVLDRFGIPLEIPGFLFIDTPGHAAFTNLRKRGGNIADMAVLVIDIREGIKPQTLEAIDILKDLSPSNWYWYVDELGLFYFKSKPSTATHTFILGKHFSSVSVNRSIEKTKRRFD